MLKQGAYDWPTARKALRKILADLEAQSPKDPSLPRLRTSDRLARSRMAQRKCAACVALTTCRSPGSFGSLVLAARTAEDLTTRLGCTDRCTKTSIPQLAGIEACRVGGIWRARTDRAGRRARQAEKGEIAAPPLRWGRSRSYGGVRECAQRTNTEVLVHAPPRSGACNSPNSVSAARRLAISIDP